MKAEDTVMTTKQIKDAWTGWKMPLPGGYTFDQWLCLAQAEISFKAGIREVVERTTKASVFVAAFFHTTEGKSFLKEWGIGG